MNKKCWYKSALTFALIITVFSFLVLSCSWGSETAKNQGNQIIKTNNNSKPKDDIGKKTEEVTKTPISQNTPGGRWNLVSVTVDPETPPQGWSYNAQSISAHQDQYNGNKVDFEWTKPPQQIDSTGFTINLSVKQQPIPNNVMSSIIGVSGKGISSEAVGDELSANAISTPGASANAQSSITFKPIPDSKEIDVHVGMMWGAVKFTYKYSRE